MLLSRSEGAFFFGEGSAFGGKLSLHLLLDTVCDGLEGCILASSREVCHECCDDDGSDASTCDFLTSAATSAVVYVTALSSS